jgi:hypothetical protein
MGVADSVLYAGWFRRCDPDLVDSFELVETHVPFVAAIRSTIVRWLRTLETHPMYHLVTLDVFQTASGTPHNTTAKKAIRTMRIKRNLRQKRA